MSNPLLGAEGPWSELRKHSDISQILDLIENTKSIKDARISAAACAKRIERIGFKYGYNTLRDILDSADNSDEIKKIFISHFDKLVASNNEKLTSMLKPTSATKVDYSALELSGSLSLVGRMGEGKNAICIEPWFSTAQNAGLKPIFVAPLRSLIAKFTASAEHYESLEDPLFPRLGLRTTAHSFVSEKFSEMRSCSDEIYFDEFVRLTEIVHSKIWGAGDFDEKIEGWKEIVAAAKSARKVVLSDAHLGQFYINIFEKLTGKTFPAFEPLTSTYSNINVAYGFTHDSLIEKTLRIVSGGGKVAFFFDGSIDEGKAIEETFTKCGLKAIFLHSAEKIHADSKVIEASVNSDCLNDYDVVICSPAIGPGWSCTLPGFTEVMIDCCGTNSPSSTLQSIKRFRAVENVSIAFSLNSSRSSARRNLPETASNVAFYQASEEFIEEAVDHDTSYKRSQQILNDKYGRAICEMIALENWSRNNYESSVVRGLQILGFNVGFATETASKEIKAVKKLSKDEIKQEKREFFSNDTMLDGRELQAAISKKAKRGVDQQAEWLIEKSLAAQALGAEKLTIEDIEFIIDNSGIEILKRIDLIGGNGKCSLSNALKVKIFNDILEFVAGRDSVMAQEIDDFIDSMRSQKLRWNGRPVSKFSLITRNLFEIKGAGSKNLIAAKGMLALLGIKLRTPKNRESGRYIFDRDIYERAVDYINTSSMQREMPEVA